MVLAQTYSANTCDANGTAHAAAKAHTSGMEGAGSQSILQLLRSVAR